MKKVAYITLIAAFIFGVQPQEAFSANDHSIEMEKGGKGQARIDFNWASEILTVSIAAAGNKEKVLIYVYHDNNLVHKEAVIVNSRLTEVEVDLAGLPGGIYTAKVLSKSIEFGEKFKKK